MVVGLSVILIITSCVMVLLVLLHKGKGGGLSDLFGGGVTSTLGSSSVVELRSLVVRVHYRPELAD
jgi:preprotein translocase subunit SecG